jgi:hypothetical protein
MTRRSFRSTLAALLMLAPACLWAQESNVRPLTAEELWSSITVNGGMPAFLDDLFGKSTRKRVRLSGELGYRSADTFFAGRQIYTDLGARYKLSPHVSVGVEHRIAFRPNDETRHRSGVMLIYKTNWNRLDLDYRFNYQHNFRDFGGQREMFRNRFGAEYDIPGFKLDPAFSAEFFTWAGYLGWRYTGVRYKFGTTWSISKAHDIGLDVLHDREYGVAWPTYRWIYSISYTLNLRQI